ncbi:hypothetical protein NDU88_003356 [Pleurodeles waltl]|uniref:Uncharacterized protein n=1 Tax=Pleurodeles waltl TaxID=8319 RepID=A0AAV7PDK9_PLEWA|nr:hypothetical protein NDU88_003356 [Pleurodeles waltl]
MVLGVETALEEVQKLMKEITELKKDIIENKALVNAKEALGPLDRSMKDFDTNTQMFKLNKLARDISLYDKKQTYPYLLEDYYKQDTRGKYSTRGRSGPRRYTTFSESSGTSGEAWREARGSFETHGEVTLDYVCLGKIKARLSRRCGLLAEQLDTLLKQEHTLIERLIGRNALKRYLWKNFETNTNRQVSF